MNRQYNIIMHYREVLYCLALLNKNSTIDATLPVEN